MLCEILYLGNNEITVSQDQLKYCAGCLISFFYYFSIPLSIIHRNSVAFMEHFRPIAHADISYAAFS